MPLRRLSRIFYGWWIVGAAFMVALYIGGAVFYGFTAIFEPVAADFGWSYAQISLAASLRGFEEGLLVPITGRLVDRWGPRRLILGGALITAGGLFVLGRATSLGMFYGAYAIIAAGMSCCTTTVLMTAIANWFRGKVGVASGIVMCGFGFGGLMVPAIVWLVQVFDWRTAVNAMGLGILTVVVPLSLVFRHKPEQYGYLPDGRDEGQPVRSGTTVLPRAEVNMKTGQAFRSGIFWRMVLVYTYHGLVVAAVVTHVMPYLSSIGISRAISGMVATTLPLMSVVGRLSMGWLGDRVNRRKVASVGFLTMGFGLLLFRYVPVWGAWLLLPFIIFFGVGYGGTTTLRPALGRECFGRANFGAIFGLLMGINTAGSMAGPLLAGWTYDSWTSYEGIWFVLAGVAVLAAVMVLTVPSAHADDEANS